MDETTLVTLEYPLILSELSRYAETPYGEELARSLSPCSDIELIKKKYAELAELSVLSDLGKTVSFGEVTDVRPSLERTGPGGAYLSSEELFDIKGNLSAVAAIKRLVANSDASSAALLSRRVDAFSDQSYLSAELKRALDDKGRLTDDASAGLFSVRSEIRDLKGGARRLLEKMLSDEELKSWLQEDLYTIRDDRFVLAIKASFHTQFKGIIHGRSASGQTYFIEPFELVEQNNRLQILKKEEAVEEIKVLTELTGVVAVERENLEADLKSLAEFDLLKASFIFGRKIDAVIPELTDDGRVHLKEARHPLLVIKDGIEAVPIDIDIEDGVKVLVISGANTGGKTVALKTLGLLSLMAASALPLPAAMGTSVNIFAKIFADIGDSQDISSDLSTFSAHIKKMGGFLSSAGPSTLVLLDEIGTGTDPMEGGVFALSVLEALRERGATTVLTTHLNLLKAHAATDEFFMNASVIFDPDTLKPAYNLSYGTPGASLGLAIAKDLGIPEDIIERARGRLDTDEGAFMESLQELSLEKERYRGLNEKLSKLEEARNTAVDGLRRERKNIVERMRKKTEKRVDAAVVEIREIVENLRELQRAGGALSVGATKVGREASKAVKAVIHEKFPIEREVYIPSEGDIVSIAGSGASAVVIKVFVDTEETELRVGNLKMRVKWAKLVKRSGSAAPSRAASSPHTGVATPEVRLSLKIIGMRVDEALIEVAAFIDDANVNGLSEVEIIHGVGTGALSSAVREYLKERREVKGFSAGEGRGGGVTVVEL